ncbi:hypothetical protein C1H46_033920 [Malus baccata]|uniref:Uncharacterized protein n=1 Tax=Malus baccata TaxID=106549 RepID=A0A540L1Z2_MALBA|nr:hypothetical protein C1H46_033920 [Malus baccata]
MSTVRIEPLLHHYRRQKPSHRPPPSKHPLKLSSSFTAFPKKLVVSNGRSFCNFQPPTLRVRAASTDIATVETSEFADAFYKETFPLKRTEVVCAFFPPFLNLLLPFLLGYRHCLSL